MSAFFYGVALQWRLDIRSKTMLITCHVVPLVFFSFMGGILTSTNPEASHTLIQSMTVFGVSMGALIGLPPSLVEIYGGDIKKVYGANGVPLFLGVVTHFISAFLHLLAMSTLIFFIAPILFSAAPPENIPVYFGSLSIFIAATLGVGSVLGLLMKNQAKLTMLSQIVFLPSILLSGILFPMDLLPGAFADMGKIFPAFWGYRLMTADKFDRPLFIPLAVLFLSAVLLCICLLPRKTGSGRLRALVVPRCESKK